MSGLLFSKPLYKGTLVKRYKRFLAQVITEKGEEIVIHCPNTGIMTGLTEPGTTVWFSGAHHEMFYVDHSFPSVAKLLQESQDVTTGCLGDYISSMAEKDVKLKKVVTKRIYEHTWQMVEINGLFIGVNTQNPNRLVRLGLMCQELTPFKDYTRITPESPVGHHRFDFLCEENGYKRIYIEVKNVHWRRPELEGTYNNSSSNNDNRDNNENHDNEHWDSFPWAYFPDTVSDRAKNHIELLEKLGKDGEKTALVYVVQRQDCLGVQASKDADMTYWQAVQNSPHVSLYGYNCLLSPLGLCLHESIVAK